MSDVKIEVLKNGPYYITGELELVDSEGKPIPLKGAAGKMALCRCGRSKEKPFCDGTHRATGWTEQETG